MFKISKKKLHIKYLGKVSIKRNYQVNDCQKRKKNMNSKLSTLNGSIKFLNPQQVFLKKNKREKPPITIISYKRLEIIKFPVDI